MFKSLAPRSTPRQWASFLKKTNLEAFARLLPTLPAADEEPGIGSAVAVIGSPRGFEFSIAEGIVSGMRNNEMRNGSREIQYTAPSSPGNSGGPVVNEQGEVIGVCSWGLRDAQNMNFAISIGEVEEMDMWSPRRDDWLDGTDDYLRGG